MRIACIATSRVPSRTANSIQVMKVCQALVDRGHTIQLWLPGRTPEENAESLLHHYGLRSQFPMRWLQALPRTRNYHFCLRAVLAARRWGAELYYTWPLQAAALASILGLPTVMEIHDRPTGRFGPTLFRLFLHGRGARRILPTTTMLRDWLSTTYQVELKEPFSVLSPNGVDLERYQALPSPQEARQRLGLEERFTAVYTGHLYAGRGIDLILELARLNPGFGFVLAGGETASVEHWRGRVQELDLVNVTFLGFVPNEQLPLIQAAGDVLLMPYEWHISVSGGGDTSETASPMKVFEYLAAGRAILSSDLPVIRELLNDENAVLLPPESTQAWNTALRRMSGEPERGAQLARRATQDARGHSWAARAQRALEGLEVTVR